VTSTATLTPTATFTFTPTLTPTTTFTPTATTTQQPPAADGIGVYKDGVWYLRTSPTAGTPDLIPVFGISTDYPVVGDWNGDGDDTIGLYRDSLGRFILSDSNLAPAVAYDFIFGNPGDRPLAGHWDALTQGSGIGVYRNNNGILYLRRNKSTGFDDYFMIFGNPGDQGVAGDWNNDGFDSVGIYRPSLTHWYLTNTNGNGVTFSDIDFSWATGGAPVVTGDWNGDGLSTPGYLTLTGVFALHPTLAAGGVDTTFAFGPAESYPVAGKWTIFSAPMTSGLFQPAGVQAGNLDQAD
jgi:hypothetical protein